MFVEHQIIILDSFLKDHVTLKTGVMITGIKYTILYIHIENCPFTNIVGLGKNESQLIASKIKVCVYIICLCMLYIIILYI